MDEGGVSVEVVGENARLVCDVGVIPDVGINGSETSFAIRRGWVGGSRTRSQTSGEKSCFGSEDIDVSCLGNDERRSCCCSYE